MEWKKYKINEYSKNIYRNNSKYLKDTVAEYDKFTLEENLLKKNKCCHNINNTKNQNYDFMQKENSCYKKDRYNMHENIYFNTENMHSFPYITQSSNNFLSLRNINLNNFDNNQRKNVEIMSKSTTKNYDEEEERNVASILISLKNSSAHFPKKITKLEEVSNQNPIYLQKIDNKYFLTEKINQKKELKNKNFDFDVSDDLANIKSDIISLVQKREYENKNRLSNEAKHEIIKLIENIDIFIYRKKIMNNKKLSESQKKRNHIESEHMRRDAINIGIKALSAIIPNCEQKSKKCVIYEAIKYILKHC